MTSADVIAILLRRWYVVAAGLVLTAGGIFAIVTQPPVYSTQADVLFLAPRSLDNPNPIKATSGSVIATTGLIARIVNAGKINPPTASSGVSLSGEGVRQGYSIQLPNSGGQWATNFDRPVLDVQVVGPSEAWVRSTLATQIGRINRALNSLQRNDGVAPENFIVTSSSPQLAKVVHSGGDHKRAIAAALVLGMTLTALAATGLESSDPSVRRMRRLTAELDR